VDLLRSDRLFEVFAEALISANEELKVAQTEFKAAQASGKRVALAASQLETSEAKFQMAKAELRMAKAEAEKAKAEIEKADAKAEKADAKAEVEKAESRVETAKDEAEKAEAKAKVDKAEAKLDKAETKLDKAEFKLDEADAELKKAAAKLEAAAAKLEAAAAKLRNTTMDDEDSLDDDDDPPQVPYVKGLPGRSYNGPVPTGRFTWTAQPVLLLPGLQMGFLVASDARGERIESLGTLPALSDSPFQIALAAAERTAAVLSRPAVELTSQLYLYVQPPNEGERFVGRHRQSVGVFSHERMFVGLINRVISQLLGAQLTGSTAGFGVEASAPARISSASTSASSGRSAALPSSGRGSGAGSTAATAPSEGSPVHSRFGVKRRRRSPVSQTEGSAIGRFSGAPVLATFAESEIYQGPCWNGKAKSGNDTSKPTTADMVISLVSGFNEYPVGIWEAGIADPSQIAQHKVAQAYAYMNNMLSWVAGSRTTIALAALRSTLPTRSLDGPLSAAFAVDGYVLNGDACAGSARKRAAQHVLDRVVLVPALVAPDEMTTSGDRMAWFVLKIVEFTAAMLGVATIHTTKDAAPLQVISRTVTVWGTLVFKSYVGSVTGRRVNAELWHKYSPSLFVAKIAEAASGAEWGLITKLQPSVTPCVGHFVCLLRTLLAMAEHGDVHGDIRESNIVFLDATADLQQAFFIDWDYGGRANERHYPRCFNAHINDGARAPPVARAFRSSTPSPTPVPILVWHDIYALAAVMGRYSAPRNDALWQDVVTTLRTTCQTSSSLSDLCSVIISRLSPCAAETLELIPGCKPVVRPTAAVHPDNTRSPPQDAVAHAPPS